MAQRAFRTFRADYVQIVGSDLTITLQTGSAFTGNIDVTGSPVAAIDVALLLMIAPAAA